MSHLSFYDLIPTAAGTVTGTLAYTEDPDAIAIFSPVSVIGSLGYTEGADAIAVMAAGGGGGGIGAEFLGHKFVGHDVARLMG